MNRHACIKEALRLHPAVAMPLERIVPPTGAQLGDSSHFLPGGTIVGMNPYVVNRDKGIFGLDAEVFRPERWLERPSVPSADGDARNGEDASEEYADEGNTKETLLRMDKTLLTFGAGSRYCIGKNISLLEMAKFVPQVLRRFELRWAGGKGKEEWEVETFWFAKQKGMGVVFVPRS
jgi:cytochrome P450